MTVSGEEGNFENDTLKVTVNNVVPKVGVTNSPIDPVKVRVPITVNSTFTDAGILDNHIAVWDWGILFLGWACNLKWWFRYS